MQRNLAINSAVAATMLAITAIGCAMLEPKGHPNTAQPVGSTWVREFQSSGSFGSATTQVTFTRRPQTTWQGQAVMPFEQSNGLTLLQRLDGSFIAVVKDGAPITTWDPVVGYEWPISVGQTFSRKQNITNHVTKQTVSTEWNAKVEAYEDVVTPAGTFKAFRVSTTDNLGNQNTNWYSSELGIFVKQQLRRTAQHSAGPGTQDTVITSQSIKK